MRNGEWKTPGAMTVVIKVRLKKHPHLHLLGRTTGSECWMVNVLPGSALSSCLLFSLISVSEQRPIKSLQFPECVY